MNTPTTDNFPQICSEVGLTCDTCTAETARHLSAVCKGLRGKDIGQLFVQLYPNAACAPAHKLFTAHYQAAADYQTPSEVPQRREVGSVRPRVLAAVA